MPTGTVALVFTDVQGSTQLWERCSDGMRGALDVHDQVLRALRLARQLEPLTAVLISINKRYKTRSGVAVSGIPGTTGTYQHNDLFDVAWDDFLDNDPGALRYAAAVLGVDPAGASALLAWSAVYALPGIALVIWIYHRWSSFKSLVLFLALTAASLLAFGMLDALAVRSAGLTTVVTAALLVSVSGVIAMLIPYAAEIYPLRLRGTGTRRALLVGHMDTVPGGQPELFFNWLPAQQVSPLAQCQRGEEMRKQARSCLALLLRTAESDLGDHCPTGQAPENQPGGQTESVDLRDLTLVDPHAAFLDAAEEKQRHELEVLAQPREALSGLVRIRRLEPYRAEALAGVEPVELETQATHALRPAQLQPLRALQRQSGLDPVGPGCLHQLVEEPADLARVAAGLRGALLAVVELLDHLHRQVDIVFLELEQRGRVVHQHVGVEHVDPLASGHRELRSGRGQLGNAGARQSTATDPQGGVAERHGTGGVTAWRQP